MTRKRASYKIKISNEEFKEIYFDNTLEETAIILKVCSACISKHAERIGVSKHGRDRIDRNVIPGGLPQNNKECLDISLPISYYMINKEEQI